MQQKQEVIQDQQGSIYEIDYNQSIGDGTFGCIYKGTRTFKNNQKQNIACKIINYVQLCNEFKQKEDYILKSLQRELELSSQLIHKNLATFYHYRISKGYVFIFMELMDGDLDHFLEIKSPLKSQKYLSFKEIKYIVKEIVEVLKYFTKNHICHRDLKPGNILFRRKNPNIPDDSPDSALNLEIKVSDLGCAKQYYTNGRYDENLTTTTGTLKFCPPEVIRGELDELTGENAILGYQKHDSWSLGIIIYRLIYNMYPFDDENVSGLAFLNKIANNANLKFDIRQNVPQQLLDAIQGLLQNKMDQRIVTEFLEYIIE